MESRVKCTVLLMSFCPPLTGAERRFTVYVIRWVVIEVFIQSGECFCDGKLQVWIGVHFMATHHAVTDDLKLTPDEFESS
jgi:hypothetical protein